jgi:hypothetical protein
MAREQVHSTLPHKKIYLLLYLSRWWLAGPPLLPEKPLDLGRVHHFLASSTSRTKHQQKTLSSLQSLSLHRYPRSASYLSQASPYPSVSPLQASPYPSVSPLQASPPPWTSPPIKAWALPGGSAWGFSAVTVLEHLHVMRSWQITLANVTSFFSSFLYIDNIHPILDAIVCLVCPLL